MAGKPLPARIVIISTQIGANEAQEHLINRGKLQQLCDDYNLPNITLQQRDICVIPDEDGEILNDINAQKQMNTLADFICTKVRELTADGNTTIHASLAGGRKTMTFFLGMAMSLYGRKGDTLSHVLVTEGYESSSQFFYPTPHSYNITTKSDAILDAQYAKVVLTEIPFVRLRDDSPQKLLAGTASYSETVEWLNFDSSNEKLYLDPKNRTISYCDKQCSLPPREFIFYLWFCMRSISKKSGLSIPLQQEPNLAYKTQYLQHYAQHNDAFKLDDISQTLKKGMTKDYFQEQKSRIKSTIEKTFGKRIGQKIMINNIKRVKGKYQFAITLSTHLISGENIK